jgi:hypothetical protein
MTKKYIILQARDSILLSEKVNNKLKDGFELAGGVAISRGETFKDVWSQAMIVKY